MIRLVRVMRILRIFKLVRHFAGLQSLFYTLQQAYQELGLLLVLVAVAILTYSSLVYFAEKDPDRTGLNCTREDWKVPKERDPCYSWTFVESFWWGLMTLTTVGYDLNPKTLLGQFYNNYSQKVTLGQLAAHRIVITKLHFKMSELSILTTIYIKTEIIKTLHLI